MHTRTHTQDPRQIGVPHILKRKYAHTHTLSHTHAHTHTHTCTHTDTQTHTHTHTHTHGHTHTHTIQDYRLIGVPHISKRKRLESRGGRLSGQAKKNKLRQRKMEA